MKIIDAHLHIWNIDRLHYLWLKEVPAINKTFLLQDYLQATAGYDIKAMVFVQCECLPEEALQELEFVHDENIKHSRIKAITIYAPLEKENILKTYLQTALRNPVVKAVRRMADNEPGLYLSTEFLQGMKLLEANKLPLELSIKPYQAAETLQMIERCAGNSFILDHLGKPSIKNNDRGLFKKHIRQFAGFPNVTAKISGLITEADWQTWTIEKIKPYVEYALEQFGFDRVMFGSDWPVLLLAGNFQQWIDALLEITKHCSEPEKEKLFYSNAKNIYRIA